MSPASYSICGKFTAACCAETVQDFQQALSAATFLLEEVDHSTKYPLAEIRRFRCYETAMVIAYARPFSKRKGISDTS
jgi:hypothetical protein